MPEARAPVDVVYVSGFGRSGSTIVEGLLQSRYAATGLGEIFFLWERGALRNELCGCGLRFRQCPFWTEVLRDAFGRITEYDAAVYDQAFKLARGRRPRFGSMQEVKQATPLFCGSSLAFTWCRAEPVAIIAFEGMQSHRWAAPPTTSRSTTVTSAPSLAAWLAAACPPGPPPMITNLRAMPARVPTGGGSARGAGEAHAPPQAAHQ